MDSEKLKALQTVSFCHSHLSLVELYFSGLQAQLAQHYALYRVSVAGAGKV